MDLNFFLATTSVLGLGTGVWALVFYRKNGNGNGHARPVEISTREIFIPGLADLPEKLERGLAPVFEGFVSRMSGQVDRFLQTPDPAPELAALAVELRKLTPPLSQLSLDFGKSFEGLTQRVEILETLPEPDWEELGNKWEALTEALEERPDPTPELVRGLAELPARISEHLANALAEERERRPAVSPSNLKTTSGPPGGGEPGGGSGGKVPSRRVPPAFARLPPGMLPATPSIPAPYVPGSVWVPAGEVSSLLALIQQQLSPNCPGTAVEFQLAADPANSDPILVGGASSLGGPLTVDNYAYSLEPSSPPRIYRSTYPGSSTPIGELQVLAVSAGYLHVEVVT